MPAPNCIVLRCASSEPRNTRRETSDRYSSCFRKSESNSGMWSRDQLALSDRFEDALDHTVGRDAFGLSLEIQKQPMAEDSGGHRAAVLFGDLVAVVEDGADFRSEDEGLRSAGAAAVADVAASDV